MSFDDYNILGETSLTDPLHLYAYNSIAGFTVLRLVHYIIQRRSGNIDDTDKPFYRLIKNTIKKLFYVTGHFYVADRAVERRAIQATYESAKLKETSTEYALDQEVNYIFVTFISLLLLENVARDLNYIRLNLNIPLSKRIDLGLSLVGDIITFSFIAASDSYIVNATKTIVPPVIPKRPTPS